MTETNFEFKFIELTEKLEEYFEAPSLSLTNLADYYLLCSMKTYDILADHYTHWRKLKKGYEELLKLMQNAHHKETDPPNKETYEHDINAIKNNKDHALNSLELYATIWLQLKESKFNFRITIIISILIAFVSIVPAIISKF